MVTAMEKMVQYQKSLGEGSLCPKYSVADLGGAVEGNYLPFRMKTQFGAPFSARRVPLILTQMHSIFSCFVLNVDNM